MDFDPKIMFANRQQKLLALVLSTEDYIQLQINFCVSGIKYYLYTALKTKLYLLGSVTRIGTLHSKQVFILQEQSIVTQVYIVSVINCICTYLNRTNDHTALQDV